MKILLNGEPAALDDLGHLVATNYGHFTVLRVEDGGVRGLDLHLDRLQCATRELFGTELDRGRVRSYLRKAVSGEAQELSVRINVFSRELDRRHLDRPVAVDVLVTTARAARGAIAPLRVKSFRYSRDLAAVKHVGTFALFHHRRLAQQAGFDDALFVDEQGRVSEGSIWNIGFVDRSGSIVWPEASQLDGVSMQLLKAGLRQAGVACAERPIHMAELTGFRAAFFTNSNMPVCAIAGIDGYSFAPDDRLFADLLRHYQSNSPQAI